MTFELITELSEFESMREEWNSLTARIREPQIFYRHEWAECFYKRGFTDADRPELCVVRGKDGNRTVAILPFILRGNVVKFLTESFVDYCTVYLDPDYYNEYVVLDKAIEFLLERKEIRRFYLMNVPGNSELYMLEDILRRRGFSAFLEENIMTPFLRAGSPSSKYHKREMKSIRRLERKLNEEHQTQFVTKSSFDEDIFAFLTKIRNDKYEKSSLKSEATRNFYRELGKALDGNFFVNALYVDGNLVAAHMGFQDERKVYIYLSAFDRAYEKENVGMILRNNIIRETVEKRDVDFMRGNEPHKFKFCDETGMNFYLLAFRRGKGTLLPRLTNWMKNNRIVRKALGR